MAKAATKSTVDKTVVDRHATTKTIRITANNAWGRNIKYFQEDIVSVDVELADLLIANGSAKATKDDVTVIADVDNIRVEI